MLELRPKEREEEELGAERVGAERVGADTRDGLDGLDGAGLFSDEELELRFELQERVTLLEERDGVERVLVDVLGL